MLLLYCLSLDCERLKWKMGTMSVFVSSEYNLGSCCCGEHVLSSVNLHILCLALLSLQKLPNYQEEIVSQSPRTRDYREKQTQNQINSLTPSTNTKENPSILSNCICPKHTYGGTLGMAHIEELLLSTFLQD